MPESRKEGLEVREALLGGKHLVFLGCVRELQENAIEALGVAAAYASTAAG